MADQDIQQTPPQAGPPQFMQAEMAPPPAAGGVLPPTSPVAPNPYNNQFLESTQSLLQQPQLAGPLAAQAQATGQAGNVAQQYQDLVANQPQRGFQPHFGGGILHDLGQALLTLGAATTPGHAVQEQIYGPKVRQYESKKAALAGELEALKGESGIAQQQAGEVTGAAGAASLGTYRGATGEAATTRAGAAVTAANAQAQKVSNDYAIQLQQVAQAWAKLPYQEQLMQAQAFKDKMAVEIANIYAGAQITRQEIEAQVQQNLANVASQSGVLKEFPWLAGVFGLTPAAPQTPGGSQPVTGPVTPPQRPPAQGATPPRPAGVPADAKWNPKTRRWYK